MLFTQLSFPLFFAIVFAGNWLTRSSHRANNLFLLAASWLFFAYWSLADLAIFLTILIVNYPLVWCAGRLSNARARNLAAVASLVVSLGTLVFFKYTNFIGTSLEKLLDDWFSIAWKAPALSLAIPLAISFYTFHIISLVLDVRDGKVAVPNPLSYALYLSFFPHVVAGPVVRAGEIVPDIDRHPRQRTTDLTIGFQQFLLGFFFKAVVGDQLADAINPFWTREAAAHLTTADAWCVAWMYSCQIFADFAGYSWMALGMAKALGFHFPENFNAPYLATTFRTFWHRWHMTLSRFLGDYLYIKALGGNKGGRFRTYVNLIATMLIGGLWHGAAWNFVIWGGIHGGCLAVERLIGMDGRQARSVWARTLWYVVVQIAVVVAWVFFRAPSRRIAMGMVSRMFDLTDGFVISSAALPAALLLTIPVIAYHLCQAIGPLRGLAESQPVRGALAGAMACAVVVMPHVPQGFIYFVF
jgi:D-alanyl-lipoteichoic acid acyltransferase DltB (MBOAT superfamily)